MRLKDMSAFRADASQEPYAGTIADNGKPILTPEEAGHNLTRTHQNWADGHNYGAINDGVINFGFWDLDSLLSSYYVNRDHTTAFNEAYYYDTFVAFNDQQKALARDAIGMWDDLVSISFHETAVQDADITFGNTDDGPYTGGYTYLPIGDRIDAFYDAAYGFDRAGRLGGDVWMNTQETANFTNFQKGYYANFALMHELGHAMGLSHTGQYNATNPDGSPNSPDYAGDAYIYQDSNQYSAMSYFGAEDTGGMWVDWQTLTYGYAGTPMVDDVVAVQQLYGADMTTRTGDTVYGFNSNADRQSFHIGEAGTFMPIFTIWDAGGNDTLDLSGYNTPSIIDINEGAYSSAGGTLSADFTRADVDAARAALGRAPTSDATWEFYQDFKDQYHITSGLYHDNIAIAYGAKIENAIGGGGDDAITGNALNNVLTGNGGNDTIRGGDGNDVLIGGQGDDQLTGGSGNDTFLYQAGGSGNDVIRDFKSGSDKIDLSAFGIDANSVKVKGTNLFADTDHNGSYDLHITVLGSAVHMSDIVFHG